MFLLNLYERPVDLLSQIRRFSLFVVSQNIELELDQETVSPIWTITLGFTVVFTAVCSFPGVSCLMSAEQVLFTLFGIYGCSCQGPFCRKAGLETILFILKLIYKMNGTLKNNNTLSIILMCSSFLIGIFFKVLFKVLLHLI